MTTSLRWSRPIVRRCGVVRRSWTAESFPCFPDRCAADGAPAARGPPVGRASAWGGEEFDDGGGGVLPEPDGDGSANRFAGQAAVADERAVAALVEDLPPERPDPHDEVAARDLRPEDLEVACLVAPDDELGAGPGDAPVSAGPDLERARGRRRPALAGLVDLCHEPPWTSGSRGPGFRAVIQPTGVVSGFEAG